MYNAPEIEKKWQKKWEDAGLHTTDLDDTQKPKFYNLIMFPYPSGDKLHIGHWYNFAPADSYGRYMRMKGYNVFEPIGFDSFGLPAENYAIKTGVHPMESIAHNCATMRTQLRAMGTMYDWNQEVVTSDPEYYQWTQWVFLQLYKKGLAYRKNAPVNWCPSCQTVLANEQVDDGHCERCKSEVTKKDLLQWFFAIREYSEQLLDYSGMDWPEKTILMQKEWIGKSEGSWVDFALDGLDEKIRIFTTRIDTLFGVTYLTLAPEHPLVSRVVTAEHQKEIDAYVARSRTMTDIDRSAADREKTGVFTGSYALHPLSGEKIPVWVGDYVLGTYGTGAVMAVPSHDERDFAFANRYHLPLKIVIQPDAQARDEENTSQSLCFADFGILVNSGSFSGMSSKDAKKKITEFLKEKNVGDFQVNYRLRDWLISRQRYWGAPIPMVYCEKCGEVPVPEDQLPVLLPEDVDFIPRGRSPLAYSKSFMKTECPKCGGKAERADETMDTFVDSSWYFLRYPCARGQDSAFDVDRANHWLPVDMYIGGPEHACMHLLYARFIHKVLHDLGYVKHREPFKKLVHQGLITKDSAKMSKSKGNVVSPDEFVSRYGSDVFRLYLMFMGPFEAGGDWNDKGITGVARFVDRFFTLLTSPDDVKDGPAMKRLVHKTIFRTGRDIQILHFNTALAAFMEFVNGARETGLDLEHKKIMARAIAPMAPHMAEEIWEMLGEKESIFKSTYPESDPALAQDETIELVVQVNGKVRGKMSVARDISQEDALKMARAIENVAKNLEGVTVMKEIYVPGKLVSFVVKG
jgi:leucyl-tRNA synthetase